MFENNFFYKSKGSGENGKEGKEKGENSIQTE